MKSNDYEEFVEKFKPKLTTDDCYTPPLVYDAVADWVAKEYGLDRTQFLRPFKPGGDYQAEKYGMFDVVVDNPPFSILQDICKWYMERGILFFLFAPHLTAISTLRGVSVVVTNSEIIYHNGARVCTAFRTNLDPAAMRTSVELAAAIDAAMSATYDAQKKTLPKYDFPEEVATVSRLAQCVKHGVDVSFGWEEGEQVRALDSMKERGKAIFGNGYLLCDNARERLTAAMEQAARNKVARADEDGVIVSQSWTISERERAIIERLNEKTRSK